MDPTDEELSTVLEHLGKTEESDLAFSFPEFAQAADYLAPLS